LTLQPVGTPRPFLKSALIMRQSDYRFIPDRECFERLLERARADAGNNLAKFFDAFRLYLWREGQRRLPGQLRSKVSPSDFIQETFMDVRKAFASFHGETLEEACNWLRTIYLNRMAQFCRQYLQIQKRRVVREFSIESSWGREQLRSLADRLKTPVEVLIEREDDLRLRLAMSHLPIDDQIIIRLRMFEKKRYDEIAEELGCAYDAARMQFGRALRRLGKLCEQNPFKDVTRSVGVS
jgi:RNA polymerase sigma-70 factor, ECF subfamily